MIAASSEQLFLSHPQSLLGTVPSPGGPHQHLWPDYGSCLFFCCFFIGNGKKRVLLPEMIAHLFFVPYSTNISLSEPSVLPDVTIQIHNHHRFCRERAKLHSSAVKESQQKFCGSKPCPASPAPSSPWLPLPQACRAPSCGKGIPCPYATT